MDDLMGFSQLQSSTGQVFSFKTVPTPATVVGATAQAMTLLARAMKLSCSPRQSHVI